MYRSGLRTFLEVGPDAKLTGLVDAILDGRPHAALAVDATRGRRGHVFDLARALAQLAALGHPVRLSLWDEEVDPATPARKPTLTVKVCGANPTPRLKPEPEPSASPVPTARSREEEPLGAVPTASWACRESPSPGRIHDDISMASEPQKTTRPATRNHAARLHGFPRRPSPRPTAISRRLTEVMECTPTIP